MAVTPEEEAAAEAYTLTTLSDRQKERVCRNCRWWDQHSQGSRNGDCRHVCEGTPHRAYRLRMPDGTHALLDSFGYEETPSGHCCIFWTQGFPDGLKRPPSYDRSH